ncbi:FadR/GntR family transcriptional regulator [Arthrobacter sp.]|uniref:FadR/GntR family transcriptional regulator n=1 Tax=Arthrobacter sp. TaxID=1667 RepID=UPI003A9068A2
MDSALEPRSSVVDLVVDRLVTAIAVGEYLPGSRLPPERDLAASLQVGRVTVRTALARLSRQGLLETVRGRGGGSFVREQWGATSGESVQRALSARWEEILDVFEAVRLLHGTIARAAAENRTEDDVHDLRARLEDYRQADTGLESQRADGRLHLAIGNAAHNTTLQEVLFQLESKISLAAPVHLWGSAEGMREMELRALADHEQLVRAISSRQPEQAGTLGSEHARIDLELFEKALQRADRKPAGKDPAAEGRDQEPPRQDALPQ